MCSVFQLKNATTVLEYEKIAEVDFEKRDFRKVRLTCFGVVLYKNWCVQHGPGRCVAGFLAGCLGGTVLHLLEQGWLANGVSSESGRAHVP